VTWGLLRAGSKAKRRTVEIERGRPRRALTNKAMRQRVASTERQGMPRRLPHGSAIRMARGMGDTMAKSVSAWIVALGLVAMFPANADAQDAARERQGQIIVANKCSTVGRFDESRNPKAPALRTLHDLYPVESLAEALAEGTISGRRRSRNSTFRHAKSAPSSLTSARFRSRPP
jgi:hypothetical protein